jgi:hypothetical protein
MGILSIADDHSVQEPCLVDPYQCSGSLHAAGLPGHTDESRTAAGELRGPYRSCLPLGAQCHDGFGQAHLCAWRGGRIMSGTTQQPALPLLHDLRVERRAGAPWHVDLHRPDFSLHRLGAGALREFHSVGAAAYQPLPFWG